MHFTLNIGLAVDATPTIAAEVALQIVAANNLRVARHAVHMSDTEPTLVVEVIGFDIPNLLWMAFNQIAYDLDQDCIAIYSHDTGRGALAGPRAKEWGPFNPAYFLTLTGRRLSETTGQ